MAEGNSRPGFGPVCLVTGGAGYLGTSLIDHLVQLGCEVHSFDMKPAVGSSSHVKSFVGDIRDYRALREACEGVSTVFHTAALINLLGLYRKRVRNFVIDVNVSGTAQVLKAAADAGVRYFVYTSTNNVSFDHEIIDGDESIPYATRPLDLYTETKGMAERLVLAADRGKTGMRTVALRPGGLWGGTEGGIMIKSFVERLVKKQFRVLIGDGSAVVDNTHLANLIDAEILAAEKLVTDANVVGGEAYYITDEEPMNGLLWFKPLVDALGYPWPTRRLPAKFMYAFGFLGELIHFLGGPETALTRIGVLKITRSHSFKTDKAHRDLGYKPRIQHEEGLVQLVPQIRKHFGIE